MILTLLVATAEVIHYIIVQTSSFCDAFKLVNVTIIIALACGTRMDNEKFVYIGHHLAAPCIIYRRFGGIPYKNGTKTNTEIYYYYSLLLSIFLSF